MCMCSSSRHFSARKLEAVQLLGGSLFSAKRKIRQIVRMRNGGKIAPRAKFRQVESRLKAVAADVQSGKMDPQEAI